MFSKLLAFILSLTLKSMLVSLLSGFFLSIDIKLFPYKASTLKPSFGRSGAIHFQKRNKPVLYTRSIPISRICFCPVFGNCILSQLMCLSLFSSRISGIHYSEQLQKHIMLYCLGGNKNRETFNTI